MYIQNEKEKVTTVSRTFDKEGGNSETETINFLDEDTISQ